jgi:hypothetical protein
MIPVPTTAKIVALLTAICMAVAARNAEFVGGFAVVLCSAQWGIWYPKGIARVASGLSYSNGVVELPPWAVTTLSWVLMLSSFACVVLWELD